MKSVPIVSTLDDVFNNKELLIYSESNSLSNLFVENYNLDKSKFINFNSTYFSEFLFPNVIKGKLVIIGNSIFIKEYLNLWKVWRKHLVVSDEKYLPDQANFRVHKYNPYTKIMRYM